MSCLQKPNIAILPQLDTYNESTQLPIYEHCTLTQELSSQDLFSDQWQDQREAQQEWALKHKKNIRCPERVRGSVGTERVVEGSFPECTGACHPEWCSFDPSGLVWSRSVNWPVDCLGSKDKWGRGEVIDKPSCKPTLRHATIPCTYTHTHTKERKHTHTHTHSLTLTLIWQVPIQIRPHIRPHSQHWVKDPSKWGLAFATLAKRLPLSVLMFATLTPA